MIKSFGDKMTRTLYEGGSPRAFRAFKVQAERKLQILDNAVEIADLQLPPGNRLEKLSGNRRDQWSIRINRQWRICFHFENGDAYSVQITDYR